MITILVALARAVQRRFVLLLGGVGLGLRGLDCVWYFS